MLPRRQQIALAVLVLVTAACGTQGTPEEPSTLQEVSGMTLEVTSPAFRDGSTIPTKYTCDGEDVSPPLRWRGVPGNARSLVLIADDPDAPVGTWVHWVMYDIPPSSELPEGVPDTPEVLDGAKQGTNDFKRIGYGGPCPPRGPAHRYFFKVYALDTDLELEPGAAKQEVEQVMEGHILAQGQLMGKYQRQ